MSTVERIKKIISLFEGEESRFKTKIGARARFCRKTGLDNSLVTHWINGRNGPSAGNLQKICTTYGVSIRWLETGEGEMLDPSSKSADDTPLSDLSSGGTINLSIEQYGELKKFEGRVEALLEQINTLRQDNEKLIGRLEKAVGVSSIEFSSKKLSADRDKHPKPGG